MDLNKPQLVLMYLKLVVGDKCEKEEPCFFHFFKNGLIYCFEDQESKELMQARLDRFSGQFRFGKIHLSDFVDNFFSSVIIEKIDQ